MIELEWDMNRARIWVDTLPDWSYPSSGTLEQSLVVTGARSIARGTAVEMLAPAGGRAYYGALGATFKPEEGSTVDVRVCVSLGSIQILKDSIVGRLDTAYIGLIPEYAGAALQGAIDAVEDRQFCAGRLQLCRAAYGMIGSSEWFFQTLGRIVIRLLALGKVSEESVVHEHVIELMQQELHNDPH